MLEELKKQDFDYLIMSAAVGDFKVENSSEFKISNSKVNTGFDEGERLF